MTQTDNANSPSIKGSIPDDEIIEIVKERFAPFKDGKAATSLAKLTKKFDHDQSTISRLIPKAFQRGLVRLVFSEDRRYPKRIEELEKALELSFATKIKEAVVVENRYSLENKDEKNKRKQSDDIHTDLGVAFAEVISKALNYLDGASIGCGSGRGVYETVHALESKKFVANDATLLSLTGSMYVRDHSGSANFFFDADDHVALLARCFARRVTLIKTSHPIAHVNPDTVTEIREKIWGNKDKLEIQHALLGVGSLAPGHRFHDAVTNEDPGYVLDSIFPLLQKLVQLSDNIGRSYTSPYTPVGDICNRLIYIPPMDRKPKKRLAREVTKNIKELKKYIEDINDRLLTIDEEELSSINNIMLIAATSLKAPAIHNLLRYRKLNIGTLCTDETAARDILSLEGITVPH
jgi:DNA-binding transcriptional regulator LsrR (DeoR family)